jgi:hypothetical protein
LRITSSSGWVVGGKKKRKVKQRSLSGMNDPRCIFTDRSDNSANSHHHLLGMECQDKSSIKKK